MQAVAIVLVVLGHSLYMYPDGTGGYTTLVSRMIYSFHMPVFMFVSGFLLLLSAERGSRTVTVTHRFLWSKVRRLLLPYLVLTLVTFVPRAALSGMADDSVELSTQGLLAGLFDSDKLIIPYMWFLQALFVISAVVYLLIKWTDKIGLPAWVPLVSVIASMLAMKGARVTTFFSLNRAVELALYFAMGGLYCIYRGKIDRVVRWSSPYVMILFCVLWVGCFFLFEGIVFVEIIALAGIAMIMSVAMNLQRTGIRILDHLEGATYLIFLLSWYFNVAAQQVLSHWVQWPWWCHTLLSMVCGIYVPWLAYRLMLKHPANPAVRTLKYLLGQ